MGDEVAISVRNLSKKYRMYASASDGIKEALHPFRKKYHTEFWALKDVSLEIKKGECIGIIGKNGSGKSTLLQILCGIMQPTSGEVRVNGRISALLELGAGFSPEFTGRENIYMNGALMGFTREEIDEKYQDIADFAEIGDFLDQPVRTYSSGMYVRLAFAVSINVEPDILIVDEALAVGDARFQLKCYKKLSDLRNKGRTVIFVTHDMNAIIQHTGTALLLQDGKILEHGNPKNAVDRYHKIVFGSKKDIEKDEVKKGDPYLTPAFSKNDAAYTKNNYNRNEVRFGSGRARILDFKVIDNAGNLIANVLSGEEITVQMLIDFYEDIMNPGYGLELKTIDGFLIYAMNTWDSNKRFEPQKKGSRISVEFKQRIPLFSGNYFFSIGVSSHDNHLEVMDARMDVFHIQVNQVSAGAGVVDLESEVKISNISEVKA